MNGIDARQADEPHGLDLALDDNRAADIHPAPPQIIFEPGVIDFFGDVSRRRPETVDQIPILPPAVDGRDVLAGELAEGHQPITSLTAVVRRAISAAPYR